MKIYLTMKQLGNRKTLVDREPYEFTIVPNSLRELITYLVREQVDRYNTKKEGEPLHFYFQEEEITARAEQTGKVGFGAKSDSRIADPTKAVETALSAFQDGLFRVFIEKTDSSENQLKEPVELVDLNAPMILADGDTLTFIRLLMLTGRLW